MRLDCCELSGRGGMREADFNRAQTALDEGAHHSRIVEFVLAAKDTDEWRRQKTVDIKNVSHWVSREACRRSNCS